MISFRFDLPADQHGLIARRPWPLPFQSPYQLYHRPKRRTQKITQHTLDTELTKGEEDGEEDFEVLGSRSLHRRLEAGAEDTGAQRRITPAPAHHLPLLLLKKSGWGERDGEEKTAVWSMITGERCESE